MWHENSSIARASACKTKRAIMSNSGLFGWTRGSSLFEGSKLKKSKTVQLLHTIAVLHTLVKVLDTHPKFQTSQERSDSERSASLWRAKSARRPWKWTDKGEKKEELSECSSYHESLLLDLKDDKARTLPGECLPDGGHLWHWQFSQTVCSYGEGFMPRGKEVMWVSKGCEVVLHGKTKTKRKEKDREHLLLGRHFSCLS